MFISIILFFFIRIDSYVWRVVIRLALIPVISGISYELIALAGKTDFFLVKLISAPGLWLQKFTTDEPDAAIVEVAIASLQAVIPENKDDDNW